MSSSPVVQVPWRRVARIGWAAAVVSGALAVLTVPWPYWTKPLPWEDTGCPPKVECSVALNSLVGEPPAFTDWWWAWLILTFFGLYAVVVSWVAIRLGYDPGEGTPTDTAASEGAPSAA